MRDIYYDPELTTRTSIFVLKNDPDPITTSVVSDGYNTAAIVRVHDNYDPYKEFNDRWCPKPVAVAKSIMSSA